MVNVKILVISKVRLNPQFTCKPFDNYRLNCYNFLKVKQDGTFIYLGMSSISGRYEKIEY